jgi:hypothetical protein
MKDCEYLIVNSFPRSYMNFLESPELHLVSCWLVTSKMDVILMNDL